MLKFKILKSPKKPFTSKDAIKKILEKYDFIPDFIPQSEQLYLKKSHGYMLKNTKIKSL